MSLAFKKYIYIGLGLVSWSGEALARGGSDETHAGDTVVMEFFDLARAQSQVLSQMPTDLLPSHQFSQNYSDTMNEMVVTSKEAVYFNGQEVNAINYPRREPPEIVISRRFWSLTPETYEQHDLLTLHEMMFLSGVNDEGFRVSTDLYSAMRLYRETRIAEILKRYIAKPNSPLRAEAFRRLERSDLVFDRAVELLYNLSRWAFLEKGERGDFLTTLNLRALERVSGLVFLTSLAGCSIDFLEKNSRKDAKRALVFLQEKGVSRRDPLYCSSLEYR